MTAIAEAVGGHHAVVREGAAVLDYVLAARHADGFFVVWQGWAPTAGRVCRGGVTVVLLYIVTVACKGA